MLTLFHHPMFATCRFVRLAFGEYGEELALIEEKPWTRRKEFLALNPAGTLPILLAEGDVPIVGAMVIAEYLDETRGVLKRDKRLFAEDPMERAEIRRLTDWYLTKAEGEVTRHLVRERVLKPVMRQIEQHLPQAAEIDAEDRQDGAELDQDLEGLAGGVEAEEMAGEQDMAGRGDRDELGQPLEQAKQQGFDNGVAIHGNLGIQVTEGNGLQMACLSRRRSPPIGRNTVTAA